MCVRWYSDRKYLSERVTEGQIEIAAMLEFFNRYSLIINSFVSRDDRLLFSWKSEINSRLTDFSVAWLKKV